jgi:hypothetical protein
MNVPGPLPLLPRQYQIQPAHRIFASQKVEGIYLKELTLFAVVLFGSSGPYTPSKNAAREASILSPLLVLFLSV